MSLNSKARGTIGVIFRGPLRPNSEMVANRINKFTEHLLQFGIIPVRYLATWKPTNAIDLEVILRDTNIENLIVLDDIVKSAVVDEVLEEKFDTGLPKLNAFRQYFLARAAINLCAENWTLKHLVHTRTDIDIEMDGPIETWFNDNYCTIHYAGGGGAFINDQFAVAPTEIMKSAWDYGSLDNLLSLLKRANKGEDVLETIINKSEIRLKRASVQLWSLDPNRHIEMAKEPVRSGL